MKDEFENAPGARESSAGDDFHLLWASRKALQLLSPNTQMKALSVEGPDRKEAEIIDPEGDKLLAIDLAEYYGGGDFSSAKKVVLSQLKYSTRNPRKEWTAARLCETRNKAKTDSIVHRLAQSFSRYYENFGREAVLSKLQLKIVSNRPISEKLRVALETAQSIASGCPSGTAIPLFLEMLADEMRGEIEALYAGSKLLPARFMDFLCSVDISDCGESSRFGQKIELIKELGNYTIGEVHTQYAELKGAIWNFMMPEAWKQPPLTKHDVLPIFLSRYSTEYPSPPKIELPHKILPRKEVSEFAHAVLSCSGKPICLHSGGGKGKTTLLLSLEKELPSESVVIIFDCYGGGTYLDPAEIRHIHRRAIPQIANELAARTGGPLLLILADSRPEDLLRKFLERITIAAGLIRKSNPEALIIIVVDAADNSIHAAEEKNQESFARDLLKTQFPEGVRLVVSCRTENIDILNLPEHESFQLRGFDSAESALHLRLFFPDATNEQTLEFHKLSEGVPRIQGYALSSGKKDIDSVLSFLKPGGKSIGDIIESRIQEAVKRSGISKSIDKICEALVALPRPVPLSYAVKIGEISPGAVESFCIDVNFGIMVEDDGTISFRDQDFEDHLRQRPFNREQLDTRIADLLYQKRNEDHYAAYNLDCFLARTGRFQELFELVIEEGVSDIVADPVERQEITLRRIKSALKAISNQNGRSEILKLLFVAAETVKTDAAVRKLIMKNADLAEKLADPLTVQRLHLEIGNQKWPVPDLFRCAAVLSRFEFLKGRAQENIREAEGWLRRRHSIAEAERHDYPLQVVDLAAGAEAILRLSGEKAAKAWLSGWKPRELLYDCAFILASSILRVDGPLRVGGLLNELPIRADIALSVLRGYQEANASPPFEFLQKTAKVWLRFGKAARRPSPKTLIDGIVLCDFVAQKDELRHLLPDLLTIFKPTLLPYPPRLYGDEDNRQVGAILSARVLEASLSGQKADSELFIPDKYKKESQAGRYPVELDREQREYNQVFGFLLPIYEIRADVLLKNTLSIEAKYRIDECLRKIEADYDTGSRHDKIKIYQLATYVLADIALMVSEEPAQCLRKIKEAFKARAGLSELLYFTLAGKAVSRPELHNEALHLLNEVCEDLEQTPRTAGEQISTFIQCARIAESIDTEIARHYFQLSVGAASEIDEEANVAISCLSSFAERTGSDPQFSDPELAYQFSRFAEDCSRRIYDRDYFPWVEITRGLSCLDPSSGFAVLSRWDDRGVIDIQDLILPLLLVSAKRGFILPETAYALSIVANRSGFDFVEFIIALLNWILGYGERKQVRKLLPMVTADIQLNIPVGDRRRTISAVVEWANVNGFSHYSEMVPLIELDRFLNQKEKEDAGSLNNGTGGRDAEIEPDWESIIGSRSFRTSEDIEEASNVINSHNRYGDSSLRVLLKKMQDRCTPKNYIAQLDALLGVKSDIIGWGALLDALGKRFSEWNAHPGVKKWREENALKFLERRFGDFLNQNRFSSYTFRLFKETFKIQEEDAFSLISKVIPEWINIPASALYNLIQEIVPSLSQPEALDTLEWVLSRYSKRHSSAWGDGPWKKTLQPPEDAEKLMGLFLWALMGHPDKRLRWRTVHGVRRMIQFGQNIVAPLIAHADDRTCPAFKDPKTYFFLAFCSSMALYFARPFGEGSAGTYYAAFRPHIAGGAEPRNSTCAYSSFCEVGQPLAFAEIALVYALPMTNLISNQ